MSRIEQLENELKRCMRISEDADNRIRTIRYELEELRRENTKKDRRFGREVEVKSK
jgi:ppGpp synthetase/RelA/SpoT-type nucleotidyltranferase